MHSTALLRCLSECFRRYGRQLHMVSRSSEPLRIVVVDDDSQIREVVGRCLVLFGASVTLCEEVFAAVDAIKRVRPDVVLVYLVMPGRDGFDLLDQIRSWGTEPGGDVPVLLLLAYAIWTWRARFGKMGLLTWPSLLRRSNCSIRSSRHWAHCLRSSGAGPHFLWLLIPVRRFAFGLLFKMRLHRLFLRDFCVRSSTEIIVQIDSVGAKNPLTGPVTSSSQDCS